MGWMFFGAGHLVGWTEGNRHLREDAPRSSLGHPSVFRRNDHRTVEYLELGGAREDHLPMSHCSHEVSGCCTAQNSRQWLNAV